MRSLGLVSKIQLYRIVEHQENSYSYSHHEETSSVAVHFDQQNVHKMTQDEPLSKANNKKLNYGTTPSCSGCRNCRFGVVAAVSATSRRMTLFR